LEVLDIPRIDATHLEERFTEVEVWEVIKSLLPDKVPGPDGFTPRFLQVAWSAIRPDIMWAFYAFWQLDMQNLHNVNESLMTLLPKTPEKVEIKDYRPISLNHIIGKLISKVLASRLAPRLKRWCTKVKVHPSKIAIFKITSSSCRPQPSFFMSGEDQVYLSSLT
jgi:hypothetical protein